MFNRFAIVAIIAISFALPAGATDQGTINQASTYEQTMKFYLHPAHGFPGEQLQFRARAAAKPAANEKRAGSRSAKAIWVAANAAH